MKTAFLHGDLKEELYMDQPKGFEDPSRPNNVCRLLKCIYGLKQASRSWNDKFDKFLTLFGFVKSSADPCIYYKKKGEVETILVKAVALFHNSNTNPVAETHQQPSYCLVTHPSLSNG